MAKRTINGSRVYSYLRFSTPEQAMGDSERRQVAGALKWAERKKLSLDDTLDLTDRGYSGYHGDHRTKGALGKFLAAVESGAVSEGSVLLVENLDRLGREGSAKMLEQIIFKLWNHGIVLQTLSPEETYDPDCGNDPKFLGLIIYLQRAWDESQRKSERITAARNWARKEARDNGRLLTTLGPAWLVVEDDKFVAIPEAVEAINMIFDLKLEGLGKERIAKRLNEEAPWSPPPKKRNGQMSLGWRGSYVSKILQNTACIGEYQPRQKRQPVGDPIPGYFPQVVEPDKFNAVQQSMNGNGNPGGRTGKANNLFVHLVKCAYCGASMAFVDKGKANGRYLVCDNARRGMGCGYNSIRYDEVEETVLANCRRLNPEQVLPNPDSQTKLCNGLRQKVAGKDKELVDIDRKLANLADQVAEEDNGAIRQRLRDKMVALEEQRKEAEAEKGEAERALATAEQGQRSFIKWRRDLGALKEGIADAPDLRLRLRAHLRELIERIDIYPVGYQQEYDPDGELQDVEDLAETIEAGMAEFNPGWKPDKEFRQFLRYVTERRMTKEGRFLRLHFKTGAKVDVVPTGSIASGYQLVQDGRRKMGWRFVSPDVDRLWRESVQQAHPHS